MVLLALYMIAQRECDRCPDKEPFQGALNVGGPAFLSALRFSRMENECADAMGIEFFMSLLFLGKWHGNGVISYKVQD